MEKFSGFPQKLRTVLINMELENSNVSWTLSNSQDGTTLTVNWSKEPSQAVQAIGMLKHKSPSAVRRDRQRKQQWISKKCKNEENQGNQEWPRSVPVPAVKTVNSKTNENPADVSEIVRTDVEIFTPPFQELNSVEMFDLQDSGTHIKNELRAAKTKLHSLNETLGNCKQELVDYKQNMMHALETAAQHVSQKAEDDNKIKSLKMRLEHLEGHNKYMWGIYEQNTARLQEELAEMTRLCNNPEHGQIDRLLIHDSSGGLDQYLVKWVDKSRADSWELAESLPRKVIHGFHSRKRRFNKNKF